ncbi:hypothetical protein Tco_0352682 [Tanacetum coccineum]
MASQQALASAADPGLTQIGTHGTGYVISTLRGTGHGYLSYLYVDDIVLTDIFLTASVTTDSSLLFICFREDVSILTKVMRPEVLVSGVALSLMQLTLTRLLPPVLLKRDLYGIVVLTLSLWIHESHIEIDISLCSGIRVAYGAIRVLHVRHVIRYVDIFTKGLPTSLLL